VGLLFFRSWGGDFLFAVELGILFNGGQIDALLARLSSDADLFPTLKGKALVLFVKTR
jgi:hypothetical protein